MPILDDKLRDVVNIRFEPHVMILEFADGRTASAPFWWYPRLLKATTAQRAASRLSKLGVHWEEIDEDLSIAGMLRGAKAPKAVPPQVAAK
jgi:Protein of unknown function (DUF2442)